MPPLTLESASDSELQLFREQIGRPRGGAINVQAQGPYCGPPLPPLPPAFRAYERERGKRQIFIQESRFNLKFLP